MRKPNRLCSVISGMVMCAQTFSVAQAAPNKKPVLTENEAQLRSQLIEKIRYDVYLDLTGAGNQIATGDNAAQPEYKGRAAIEFRVRPGASDLSKDLLLDFSGEDSANIWNLKVNERAVKVVWESGKTRIAIPVSSLKEGAENKIELQFSTHFTRKGKGFHRAVDAEDSEVYIYTNLEPYFANEVFPIFDQPNLKASFRFQLAIPENWIAIANTLEETVKEDPDHKGCKLWTFLPTPLMSTYLIGLSAGPFTVFEPSETGRVPLRLFARKSLAKFVEKDVWFELTRSAFAEYEALFGPYPYRKYDQILTPGTASGAMESLAAVTFNENYVSKGKMSPADKTRLANTLTHEMAHQWFGNLVTMDWWGDLWLNESFATFMASWVLTQTGEKLGLLDAASRFFGDEKVTAYLADAYSTTHPIVMKVEDTLTGFSNFDSITYDKGASVLKQLFFYVGKDAFFEGIRAYFAKFAEKNATRKDFLDALSASSGKDLGTWGQQWMQTAGTNSVKAEYSNKDGVAKVTLYQTRDPISGTLRSHKTRIGLYNLNSNGEVERTYYQDVEYSGEVTEILLPGGIQAPDWIFPNSDDFDFANVILDERSLAFVHSNLKGVSNSLLKQGIIFSLWQMVQHAQFSAGAFVDLVIRHSDGEKEASLIESICGELRAALRYMPVSGREEANQRIVSFLVEQLKKAEPSSNAQEAFLDALLAMTLPSQEQDLLVQWLKGSEAVSQSLFKGLPLNSDRKWEVRVTLSRSGNDQSSELVDSAAAEDKSDRGVRYATAARMAYPDFQTKKIWFDALATPKRFVAADTGAIARETHSILDPQLSAFVETDLLQAVAALATGDLDRKTGYFIRNTYPVGWSEEFDERVKAYVNGNPQLSQLIQRALLEKAEDSSRMFRARRLQ